TIDNLIERALEADIIESEVTEISEEIEDLQNFKPIEHAPVEPTPAEPISIPEKVSDESPSKEIEKDDSDLTELPPKPESLLIEEPEQPEVTLPSKLKTKGRTKKDLKNEKNGLESKLSSVQDLLQFIDKKHSSGKINDDEYSKRSKKLQTDIKKTKKRIDVIGKLLEK
ncbi:MAG: hypothetical protein ACXAEX_18070, partial [Promethearchaeota archaeon]